VLAEWSALSILFKPSSSNVKEILMKLRRLTSALAIASFCIAGAAQAQTMAPTTPSTTPNDTTATPPNNGKVPPGTANPTSKNSGATPSANTHKGTKNSDATHTGKSHSKSTKSSSGSMNHGTSGNMAEPTNSAPNTGGSR